MNGRRADAKVLLHVGFGWSPPVQARVEVDKCQVLALLRRECCCRATHICHPIQSFVDASNKQEAQVNVRYRVDLSQAERDELGLLSACRRRNVWTILPAPLGRRVRARGVLRCRRAVRSWRQEDFLNYFKGKFSLRSAGPD